MANNRIQIKRTSVTGRAANTTTLTQPGELALNMTDGIMYSTNGSVVFEIGANNTNQRVSGTLTVNAVSANGGVGTSGQVLTSNGTSAYWSTSSTLNAQQTAYTYTLAANTTVISGADDGAATLSYVAGLENVFINGVRQISGVDYNTTNATAITLTANAIAGEVVQVVAWTGSITSTNVNAQFAWTNTHSFSNTVTLKAISANGSLGTAGHVLHSNGTSTYWAADDNAGGTVTSIATANGLTGGTITTTGTLGVATGSTLTVNTTGIHVNSALAITSVDAASLTVSTNVIANTTQVTSNVNVLVNNNKHLRFQTVNSSAYAYFVQQNDDNFVFYTSNTTYGQRAVWSVFANSITSTMRLDVPIYPLAGIAANGAIGTAGQVLKSNGAGIFWDTSGGTGTVTSVATGNGLTGGTITTTGTLSVTGGSTLTVNSTGIHVNSALVVDTVAAGNNGNGTNFKVGDDTWLGDINTADTLSIRGQQSANNGYIVFGNADTTTKLGRAGLGALTYNGAFAAGNTTVTGFANVTTTLQVGGVATFAANVVLGSSGLSANGGFGSSGQVLHSNGSAAYWAADDGISQARAAAISMILGF